MQECEIGYCPTRMDWQVGDVSIVTNSDVDETVAAVEADPGVKGEWIYAPQQKTKDILSGTVSTMPYSSRVFGLPKTHTLCHGSARSEEHIRFMVWCIGFFTGMRLTVDEGGFIDATPIKPGVLHDIVWLGDSLSRTVEYTEAYWHRYSSDPRISKGLAGVIHSYFLSQNPTLLDFEQFTYLYIALDGCYRVCDSMLPGTFSGVRHIERITKLRNHFGISISSETVADIASCRNDTLHEGLFFGEPLGFQIYGGVNHHLHRGTLLELTKLVSRLIVAMLDLPATSYIQSRMDDRQQHGIRF